ncbi:tetratricopeptide repeat protein [Spirochaeta dissipatitropha]
MNRSSRLILLFLSLSLLVLSCATDSTELARDYYNLGVGYLDQGNYDQARDYLRRSLDLDPGQTRASYNLSRVYILLDNPDAAILLLEDLLEEDSGNIMVRETLAYAHGVNEDWDEAVRVMSGITQEHTVSVRGWVNYAVALYELQRYSSAYNAAEKALALDPQHKRAKTIKLVAAAYIPNRLEEYSEELQKFVEQQPDNIQQARVIGAALEHAGRYDSVLVFYDTAARAFPANGEMRFAHARVLIEAVDDQERGVEMLSQAISRGFEDQEKINALVKQITIELPETLRTLQEALDGNQESSD